MDKPDPGAPVGNSDNATNNRETTPEVARPGQDSSDGAQAGKAVSSNVKEMQPKEKTPSIQAKGKAAGNLWKKAGAKAGLLQKLAAVKERSASDVKQKDIAPQGNGRAQQKTLFGGIGGKPVVDNSEDVAQRYKIRQVYYEEEEDEEEEDEEEEEEGEHPPQHNGAAEPSGVSGTQAGDKQVAEGKEARESGSWTGEAAGKAEVSGGPTLRSGSAGSEGDPAPVKQDSLREKKDKKKKEKKGRLVLDALRDGSDLANVDTFYIDPRSLFRTVWDGVLLVLVLYNLVGIPYTFSFKPDQETDHLIRNFDYVVDGLFLVDIGLNFITAYYDQYGRLVAKRSDIIYNYLHRWFLIDLLASLPFESIFGWMNLNFKGSATEIVDFFKFPRLLRFGRILKYFEKVKYANLLRIFQLLLLIVIIVHWLACLWYKVCLLEDEGWCKENGLPFASNEDLYLHAAYSMMISLQGENVGPYTQAQYSITLFSVLLGGFVYAVVFGNVASLVNSISANYLNFQTKMNGVKEIMRYIALPKDVSDRILQYYEYLWLRYRNAEAGLEGFTTSLPTSLRDEVLLHLNADLLHSVPTFRQVDVRITLEMIRHMHTTLALPGDIVIRRGDMGAGLFHISRGRCEVLVKQHMALSNSSKRRPKVNPVLTNGDYFGELSLITENPVQASVMALTFCDLHVLLKDDFNAILELYPELLDALVANRISLFMDEDDELTMDGYMVGLSDRILDSVTDLHQEEQRNNMAADRGTAESDTNADDDAKDASILRDKLSSTSFREDFLVSEDTGTVDSGLMLAEKALAMQGMQAGTERPLKPFPSAPAVHPRLSRRVVSLQALDGVPWVKPWESLEGRGKVAPRNSMQNAMKAAYNNIFHKNKVDEVDKLHPPEPDCARDPEASPEDASETADAFGASPRDSTWGAGPLTRGFVQDPKRDPIKKSSYKKSFANAMQGLFKQPRGTAYGTETALPSSRASTAMQAQAWHQHGEHPEDRSGFMKRANMLPFDRLNSQRKGTSPSPPPILASRLPSSSVNNRLLGGSMRSSMPAAASGAEREGPLRARTYGAQAVGPVHSLKEDPGQKRMRRKVDEILDTVSVLPELMRQVKSLADTVQGLQQEVAALKDRSGRPKPQAFAGGDLDPLNPDGSHSGELLVQELRELQDSPSGSGESSGPDPVESDVRSPQDILAEEMEMLEPALPLPDTVTVLSSPDPSPRPPSAPTEAQPAPVNPPTAEKPVQPVQPVPPLKIHAMPAKNDSPRGALPAAAAEVDQSEMFPLRGASIKRSAAGEDPRPLAPPPIVGQDRVLSARSGGGATLGSEGAAGAGGGGGARAPVAATDPSALFLGHDPRDVADAGAAGPVRHEGTRRS